jgi:hypothetical protein
LLEIHMTLFLSKNRCTLSHDQGLCKRKFKRRLVVTKDWSIGVAEYGSVGVME